jgi:ArsR family transcriptional regulator, arsenate/arsenite/antimonite-responsive transcriptional repressor
MLPTKDARLASMDTLFKALGDPTRLRILGLLAGGEVCVCDIHESLGIPQPRASRHLSYLRRAGLVQTRKDGLWVHYQLAPLDDKITRTLVASVTHCLSHVDACCHDFERLEKKTGCSAPGPVDLPSFDCCRPRRGTAVPERRRTRDRRRAPRS